MDKGIIVRLNKFLTKLNLSFAYIIDDNYIKLYIFKN